MLTRFVKNQIKEVNRKIANKKNKKMENKIEIIKEKFAYSNSSFRGFTEKEINQLLELAKNSTEPFVDANEIGLMLDRSSITINTMANNGNIPAFRFKNRWWFKKSLISVSSIINDYQTNNYATEFARKNYINKVIDLISIKTNSNEAHQKIFMEYIKGETILNIANKLVIPKSRVNGILNDYLKKINRYFADPSQELKEENLILNNRNFVLRSENTKLRMGINDNEKRTRKNIGFKLTEKLNQKIEILDLNPRAFNVLKDNKINTLYELVQYESRELSRLRNCGDKSVTEIENALEQHGLSLGMSF